MMFTLKLQKWINLHFDTWKLKKTKLFNSKDEITEICPFDI